MSEIITRMCDQEKTLTANTVTHSNNNNYYYNDDSNNTNNNINNNSGTGTKS